MALSSDELVKRELIDYIGVKYNGFEARVFPEGSNQDQIHFSDGGLTFSYKETNYGSCDLAYIIKETSIPFMAIEGTDALNRGSSGNAQYQRFHHALGAVKNGFIGIYYLREGNLEVREDLYAMAYHSSIKEKGYYIITQSLDEIKKILDYGSKPSETLYKYLDELIYEKYKIFLKVFNDRYKNSWKIFAEKRSTIIFDKYIIKYSARNILNFTDGSQRAGHIAVGEMYLTKYFFPEYEFYYLWPRMNSEELKYLNDHKKSDKEWNLLSTESNVNIITRDDILNIPEDLYNKFKKISHEPLKGVFMKQFNEYITSLRHLLEVEECTIEK